MAALAPCLARLSQPALPEGSGSSNEGPVAHSRNEMEGTAHSPVSYGQGEQGPSHQQARLEWPELPQLRGLLRESAHVDAAPQAQSVCPSAGPVAAGESDVSVRQIGQVDHVCGG